MQTGAPVQQTLRRDTLQSARRIVEDAATPLSRCRALLGSSPAHTLVLRTLDRIARTDAEVLISGPTGTGKELYAVYLHQRSHRSQAPFVPVNCGGLPSELIENELFGHVGG